MGIEPTTRSLGSYGPPPKPVRFRAISFDPFTFGSILVHPILGPIWGHGLRSSATREDGAARRRSVGLHSTGMHSAPAKAAEVTFHVQTADSIF